nr:electron transfer flavoprotein beta subunit lysine methyltransferase-like [Danaus plexippus plexippus]XP_032521857.1 electron transfer flavoprotein beta subunit lysine methyltransferase-like [Danaus plexippus plexippus]
MMLKFKALFLQHTALTRNHLTPEILLRLVTPGCPLWSSRDSPFEDPFWAFYWPGGQATARYILDNPLTIKDRRVLDVGSGCGAGAIAAALVGTKRVLANDIDPVAVMAIKMNAELNNVEVQTDTNNYIGTECEEFDAILIGDMFYDEDFGNMLFGWLRDLASQDKLVK